MTTGRQIFIIKKIVKRYGLIGKVTARYVAAGYNVTVKPPIKGVDFIASGQGKRYGGFIVAGKTSISAEKIEELSRTAKIHGLEPLVILYGRGATITAEALEKAKELGVKIRRVRPNRLRIRIK